MDLSPAQWVWLPCARTLPNTFVLFRRELNLSSRPTQAVGWISADSRYLLTINGERVQWGPAPCDPRYGEADPLDLTPYLQTGKNVIGVEVLHYGVGEGTWAGGKPGFIFKLGLELENGEQQSLVSDGDWLCYLDRAHRPGVPKRWYLRALQEDFDARLHPYGWNTPDYQSDSSWLQAAPIGGPSDKPTICAASAGNDLGDGAAPEDCRLIERPIPPMRELLVEAKALSECGRVLWKREPRDWFEFRMRDSFEIHCDSSVVQTDGNSWNFPATAPNEGLFATWEFEEQMVGWPRFVIEAAAGTVVEIMIQEAHDPISGPAWLDTHFHSWSRFVCREGVNIVEPFDFECLRWMQLHIREATSPVKISQVGLRRRLFDWPHPAQIECADPALGRLFGATVNTLNNSCQETCVDGMSRERQQYSGDAGHQIGIVRFAFGETRQPARFLSTWSQGMTLDGYFLDCWPGLDRLARLAQRQVGTTQWGPLLDHGVQFFIDCWLHYLETGDLDAVREPYPRLLRFANYLKAMRRDGLLPVENLGVPTVWIDHYIFEKQSHKACPFNLHAVGALRQALAPLCEAMGDNDLATEYRQLADELLRATQAAFWCPQRLVFVDNRLDEGAAPRLSDRALAHAVLDDLCPDSQSRASIEALANCPPEMGISYPANALWRYHALAKAGRTDVAIKEFREQWAKMDSVLLNNTLQEDWGAHPDSTEQWSHCPVAPLHSLFRDIVGLRALEPGFTRLQIRPQLADIGELKLNLHIPQGPIHFHAIPDQTGYRLHLNLPPGCEGEIVLPGGRQPLLTGESEWEIAKR